MTISDGRQLSFMADIHNGRADADSDYAKLNDGWVILPLRPNSSRFFKNSHGNLIPLDRFFSRVYVNNNSSRKVLVIAFRGYLNGYQSSLLHNDLLQYSTVLMEHLREYPIYADYRIVLLNCSVDQVSSDYLASVYDQLMKRYGGSYQIEKIELNSRHAQLTSEDALSFSIDAYNDQNEVDSDYRAGKAKDGWNLLVSEESQSYSTGSCDVSR